MTVIRRRKLYEDIAQHLEQRIRDQDVAPGDQLPSERELMREFGVGRPAVREALFHLQKMGLVELRSGGAGARHAADAARSWSKSLAGSRALSAGRAGRRAAFPGGAHLLRDRPGALCRGACDRRRSRDLRDALEANRQSLGDLAKFERTDVEFHYVLAVIPQQSDLQAIHAAIAEWLVEQRHVTLTYPGGRTRVAYEAHRADLRSDRRARSGPRRARDPRASRSGGRALLAGEGGRGMSGFVIMVDFRLKPGAKAHSAA